MGLGSGNSVFGQSQAKKQTARSGREIASTASPSTIRDINRSILLNLIRLHQPVSRARLAVMTGMFRSSVSDIVKELVDAGLLIEKRATPEGRGRVPVMLSLNDRGFEVIGVSVRFDQTTVAVAGLTGKTGERLSFATPQAPAELVAQIAAAAARLSAGGGEHRSRSIQQIGVSVPGLVDANSGRVRWLPRIPACTNFDLASALEQELNAPVAVDNDANLAALAEVTIALSEHDALRDFVFLDLGAEGVGGGMILNGELYRGHDATLAAEFGHMVIEANGLECSCGRKGCWEMYVSDRATLRRYAEMTGVPAKSYSQFLQAAREGDPVAQSCLESTARYIAIGLTNIAFAINPAAIVVSGRIRDAWEAVSPVVDAAFAATRLALPVRRSRQTSEELFLQGAILLALDRAFSQPDVGLHATAAART
jgi:predicted NBD/HSP70 family sugar kinase/biotin operon repressor